MGAVDIFREAYGEHGVYLIAPISCSGIALFSNRALRTPEDWKGFKVRSTGTAAEVFKKMGATPVYFPGAELYQALQTGVCEGAHWGAVFNGWEMKLHEVNKYIILPFMAKVSNAEIFMNQKLWKTLPADVKQVLESCAVDVSAKMQSNVYGDYLKIDEFQKKGFGELVNMDEKSVELLTKYSLDVIDEYSKKDPKYCGRAGALLKEFFRIRARI
jgi:TRAP-type C4-dicarboxylate transport system substrate-binding protein